MEYLQYFVINCHIDSFNGYRYKKCVTLTLIKCVNTENKVIKALICALIYCAHQRVSEFEWTHGANSALSRF